MSSMAARLARKTRRRTTYDLALSDPTPDEQQEMDDAAAERRLAKLRHGEGSPEHAATLPRWQAARDAIAAHVLTLTFEGIPERELDEIRALPECEPTAEQIAEHDKAVEQALTAGEQPPLPPEFNPDAVMPLLFARCVVPDDGDEPMTAEQWAHELRPAEQGGTWVSREKAAAMNACLTAIMVPRSVSVPKG